MAVTTDTLIDDSAVLAGLFDTPGCAIFLDFDGTLVDLAPTPDGDLKRVPYPPYVEALRHWQRRLNRVTTLDEDPFDDPVNLEDVQRAAAEEVFSADANWS